MKKVNQCIRIMQFNASMVFVFLLGSNLLGVIVFFRVWVLKKPEGFLLAFDIVRLNLKKSKFPYIFPRFVGLRLLVFSHFLLFSLIYHLAVL